MRDDVLTIPRNGFEGNNIGHIPILKCSFYQRTVYCLSTFQ